MNAMTARTHDQEAAHDLFFGQIVTIWARWFVILGCALLALWSAGTATELAINVTAIVSLMAVNFFLHGRYLAGRPANEALTLLVSLFDLAVITTIVLSWHGQSGLDSRYFVFYYPVVFAFALIFAPRLAITYTVLSTACYAIACLAADPGLIGQGIDLKQLVMRSITIVAMGGLGAYYWRIQRSRQPVASVETTARPLHANAA